MLGSLEPMKVVLHKLPQHDVAHAQEQVKIQFL